VGRAGSKRTDQPAFSKHDLLDGTIVGQHRDRNIDTANSVVRSGGDLRACLSYLFGGTL
jgi:hypothetical protein